MALFLLELYRPAGGAESLRRELGLLRSALEAAGARCVGTVLVPQDDAALVTVDALSMRVCEDASALTGVSFERISPAEFGEGSK